MNKKKVVYKTPQNLEEANHYVSKIKELQAEIQKKEQEANGKIAALEIQIDEIKKKLREDVTPLETDSMGLAKEVHIFAQAHRETLIEEAKKKTIILPSGNRIRWYYAKSYIAFENEDQAVAELKAKGVNEAIRIIEEVNKRYLLDNPNLIKDFEHLTIGRDEHFAIELPDLRVALQKEKFKFKFKKNAL